MNQQPDQNPGGAGVAKGVSLLVINALACIGEMFLHIFFGWLYPAPLTRMVACGLPYLWLVVWADKSRREGYPDDLRYLAFLPVVLFWLMLGQWVIAILVRRREYSLYTGTPLLKLALPFLGGVFIKHWLEPLLIGGLAWWYYHANRPLMSFLIAVAASMFLAGRLRAMQEMFREQGYIDSFHKPF